MKTTPVHIRSINPLNTDDGLLESRPREASILQRQAWRFHSLDTIRIMQLDEARFSCQSNNENSTAINYNSAIDVTQLMNTIQIKYSHSV